MQQVFDCLVVWLAPVLCFTAEEAWAAAGNTTSVHLELFPDLPAGWQLPALAADWTRLREIRRVVTGAIELARAEKTVGSSLQAAPVSIWNAPPICRCSRQSMRRKSASPRACICAEGFASGDDAPAGAFTLSDVPGVSRWSCSWRRAKNASAAGGCCPR